MRAIEKQTTVTARDRAKLASYLTAVFADDPEYLTKITFILVGHYMKEKASDRSPKLAFRRADSVAEKMISHWLHLSLFDHIQGESGRNLWVSLNFKLRPTLCSLFRLKIFFKVLGIFMTEENVLRSKSFRLEKIFELENFLGFKT